jgi:acyl-ACP thioesterase
MESVFKKTYTVETIHLDRFGAVKPSVMLYFAQEAATGHCDLLALDWDTLAKKHLFWAVIRHRLQVSRPAVAGDVLTVETWPMPTTRSAFPRATVAYDQNGNEVFRCISLWVLMDTETRAMVLPGKSGITLTGLIRGNELSVPSSILPKAAQCRCSRTVGYTDLDRNGHVNNTRYLEWMDDLLTSDFHRAHTLKELSVCYLSEAKEAQQIQMDWQLFDGPILQVDAHTLRTNVDDKESRVFSILAKF